MQSAVALVGEVDGLEAVTRWFAAVTDTFIQSARNPVQAFVQLLPNVPIVFVGQEQDRGASQVLHSGKQFVSHPSTPAMHAVGAGDCCPQHIKAFVGLEHRFRCPLKIIGASILRLLENQQIGIYRVNRRDGDRILPTEGRQFQPSIRVVRVSTSAQSWIGSQS